mgnify:CR=1 FL=1
MKNPGLHNFFSKFPSFTLDKVVLRDLQLKDAENYFNLYNFPEVSEYLSDEDVPKSVDEALKDVKFWGGLFYQKRSIFWAIADKETDNLIGTVGFVGWNFHNRRLEVSYDLMPQYWRQGIMTGVLTEVFKLAFNKMQAYRIEARTMVKNEKSQAILRKIGFEHEGILRGYRIINKKPEDITLFSLIAPDYAKINRQIGPIS